MSKCARGGGITAKRKSGTRATAILLCIGHNTGSETGPRGSVRAAVSGTRCMLKPCPASLTGEKTSGNSQRPVWRRSWARRRQHFLISGRKAVVRYAREHNLGKIILGRPASRRWWRRETFADRLARIAPISIRYWSRLMNHPPHD